MDNPGPLQLTLNGAAFQITGPGTQTGDWITGLAGITALSLQAKLAYGSGGTTCTVYVQTSIDQGQTAVDIAAVQFTTAGGTEVVNLSGLTPKTTPAAPTDGALTPGTCVDGILGDRFRAKVVTVGTYAGSTGLNVTGIAR